MVYPGLVPLMRTPQLPVVDWTDPPPPPADLNGLVRFARKTKSGFCACAITFRLAPTSQNLRIDVTFESGDAYSENLLFQSFWRVKFCSTSSEKYLQYAQVYRNWGDGPVPPEQQTAVGRVLRRAHSATSLTSVCCMLSNYNIAGVISVHRLWTELVSVNYCKPSNSKINLNYIYIPSPYRTVNTPISLIKTYEILLFGENVAFYSEIHTKYSLTWVFLPFVYVFYFVSYVLLLVLSCLVCNCSWLAVCIVVVVLCVLL